MNINFLITASGLLGNVISFLVFLAPVPTFYDIYKRKSTEGFQSIPYIVSLFSAMLWIYYAFLKPNSLLLLTINSVGIVAQTIYICLFLYYATKRARMHTLMLLMLDVGGMGVIVMLTHFLQKEVARVSTVGWICLIFSLSVFVAPLAIIRRVIKTKSVEYMPFYLSLFLTLSAIAWFFYGLLRKDFNIALPNVLGFTFGLMQMALYMFYKNSNTVTKLIETEIKQQHTTTEDHKGPDGAPNELVNNVNKLCSLPYSTRDSPSPAHIIASPMSVVSRESLMEGARFCEIEIMVERKCPNSDMKP